MYCRRVAGDPSYFRTGMTLIRSHDASGGSSSSVHIRMGGRTRILELRAFSCEEISAETSSAVAVVEHIVTTTLPEIVSDVMPFPLTFPDHE